jgi:hypothetical protein
MLRLASRTHALRTGLNRVGNLTPIQSRSLTNLKVGVLKESDMGEGRVSLVPADVAKLVAKGATVSI